MITWCQRCRAVSLKVILSEHCHFLGINADINIGSGHVKNMMGSPRKHNYQTLITSQHVNISSFKWVQQFHLKVSRRYCNAFAHLKVLLLDNAQLFSLLILKKNKTIRAFSVCVMYLKESIICTICVGNSMCTSIEGAVLGGILKVCMSLTRGSLPALSPFFYFTIGIF